ncbi:hypothetical protein FOZ62_001283, partial [Perkinsus olseni]
MIRCESLQCISLDQHYAEPLTMGQYEHCLRRRQMGSITTTADLGWVLLIWSMGDVLMSWLLFDFCLSSSNHLQPDMIVDEDPPCPASEDTPAVGNSPLTATRGTHASSETKHNTEPIVAAPPAGSSVSPSRTAPVEVVTRGSVSVAGGGGCPSISTANSSPHASSRVTEAPRDQTATVSDSERALERAQEIISTIGMRPSVTEQSLTEVEPLGSAKEAGSSLADQPLDQPLDRFERLYADGAERADRLATAQAQKRMDELLEGPGTATGRRKVVSKETHRGPCHKSPMKPPVSVLIGGQSGTSRFERLYAEGAEREARRKDLERSIVEEEDAKLKE